MGEVKKTLKILRVKLGLTQEEFAKYIDIPISTYRKKENCESKFTLEEAYRISKIADIKMATKMHDPGINRKLR